VQRSDDAPLVTGPDGFALSTAGTSIRAGVTTPASPARRT